MEERAEIPYIFSWHFGWEDSTIWLCLLEFFPWRFSGLTAEFASDVDFVTTPDGVWKLEREEFWRLAARLLCYL